MALRERLQTKIDERGPDECWPFQGARTPDGYGVIRDDARRLVYAHRATLELLDVSVEGKVVRHSCDNPPCCNPRHLKAGTHVENMDDWHARGHGNRGVRNGNAKLTDRDVRKIRKLAGSRPQHEIAAMFGVTQSTISAIVTGDHWRHLADAA